MNNRLINGLVIASLLVGQSFGLTSCTDYDDDIKNLQTQIDGINVSLGELQQLIKSDFQPKRHFKRRGWGI